MLETPWCVGLRWGVLRPLLALSLTEDLQVDTGAQSSTVVIKELFILKAISKL